MQLLCACRGVQGLWLCPSLSLWDDWSILIPGLLLAFSWGREGCYQKLPLSKSLIRQDQSQSCGYVDTQAKKKKKTHTQTLFTSWEHKCVQLKTTLINMQLCTGGFGSNQAERLPSVFLKKKTNQWISVWTLLMYTTPFLLFMVLKYALKRNCSLFVNRNAQDRKLLLKVTHLCAVSSLFVFKFRFSN